MSIKINWYGDQKRTECGGGSQNSLPDLERNRPNSRIFKKRAGGRPTF
jgi:hypothetical protein